MADKPHADDKLVPGSSTGSSLRTSLRVQGRGFVSEDERLNFKKEVLMKMLKREVPNLVFQEYSSQKINPTPQQRRFLDENISVNLDLVLGFALETVSQSFNRQWFLLRRLRISSSIAHDIVTRSPWDLQNLATQLVNKKFVKVEAVDYGMKMENAARCAFKYDSNVEVMMCGVVISETLPWLCCSPDGIVLSPERTLLEIKCPFTRKGAPIVDHERHLSHVPYVTYEGNSWCLKKHHRYYTQIQLSLFILKLETCILFVYSGKDRIQIEVKIDRKFLEQIIPKLEHFYYFYFLDMVMNKYTRSLL